MKKVLFIISLLIALRSDAQVDPHFSQFYANPLWMNPGMAGVMDGNYRITAIYRNQWSQVMVPFVTTGFSLDLTTNKNINIGASLLKQTAGDGGYQYLNGGFTIAYSGVKFGPEKEQQIVIGIQGGILGRRFDASKFQFGDQWNPVTGYDPGTTSADQLNKTNASAFDVGTGISYMDGTKNKALHLFAGVSAFHLTKPQDPFINAGDKQYLPVRLSFHGGARIDLNDRFSVIPNLLWMKQGTAQEKMIGLDGDYQMNDNTALLMGVNYRFQDAVSPFAGFRYGGLVTGISYDIHSASVGKTVPGANSIEISVSWINRKTGKPLRYLSCPRF